MSVLGTSGIVVYSKIPAIEPGSTETGTVFYLHTNPCDEIMASEGNVMPTNNGHINAGLKGVLLELGSSIVSSEVNEINVHSFLLERPGSHGNHCGEAGNHEAEQIHSSDLNSYALHSTKNANRHHHHQYTSRSRFSCCIAPLPPYSLQITETDEKQDISGQFASSILPHSLPLAAERLQVNVADRPPNDGPVYATMTDDVLSATQRLQSSRTPNTNGESFGDSIESRPREECIQRPVIQSFEVGSSDVFNVNDKTETLNAITETNLSGKDYDISQRKKEIDKNPPLKRKYTRDLQFASFVREKKISEKQFRDKHSKELRRPGTSVNGLQSRFCHICKRTEKHVRHIVCRRVETGLCRKVVCEYCCTKFNFGDFEKIWTSKQLCWLCPHCTGICPPCSLCKAYAKRAQEKRVERLAQRRLNRRNESSSGDNGKKVNITKKVQRNITEREEKATKNFQASHASSPVPIDNHPGGGVQPSVVLKSGDCDDYNAFLFSDIPLDTIRGNQIMQNAWTDPKSVAISPQDDVDAHFDVSHQFTSSARQPNSLPQTSSCVIADGISNNVIGPFGSVDCTSPPDSVMALDEKSTF